MPNIALELGSAWSMIPPVSPHWGGLWEAGVKQAKFHLRKVIGRNILTYEEMMTIVIEIESMLNTRPLCELNDDPLDLRVLTPGSLLLARAPMFLPDRPVAPLVGVIPPGQEHPEDLKRRWQWIQRAKSEWWSRWTKDYLPSLQIRTKWHKETEDLRVGDLVLITDDDVKSYQWPVGRVLDAYVGNDARCRSARVQSHAGIYTRPVVKLRKLPIE